MQMHENKALPSLKRGQTSVGATLVVALVEHPKVGGAPQSWWSTPKLVEHPNVSGKRAGRPQGSPLRALICVICCSILLTLMLMGRAYAPAQKRKPQC